MFNINTGMTIPYRRYEIGDSTFWSPEDFKKRNKYGSSKFPDESARQKHRLARRKKNKKGRKDSIKNRRK